MTTTQITARLALIGDLDESPIEPHSWFITHQLGGPAAHTFTEVAFAPGVLDGLKEAWPNEDEREVTLSLAVREAAVALYGRAWAFTYPPEKFDDAIGKHGMRRRERVLVTEIATW